MSEEPQEETKRKEVQEGTQEKEVQGKDNSSDRISDGVATTTPLIENAREEREKLEKVVKELKAENDRRELIMAKQALGGRSEAGQELVKKEETDKEYSERIDREIREGKTEFN